MLAPVAITRYRENFLVDVKLQFRAGITWMTLNVKLAYAWICQAAIKHFAFMLLVPFTARYHLLSCDFAWDQSTRDEDFRCRPMHYSLRTETWLRSRCPGVCSECLVPLSRCLQPSLQTDACLRTQVVSITLFYCCFIGSQHWFNDFIAQKPCDENPLTLHAITYVASCETASR